LSTFPILLNKGLEQMTDALKKAFDFAADLTKQLITLATAIIGAIVTFFDKAHLERYGALKIPLLIYLVSILFGVWTLMALTGTLGRVGAGPVLYSRNIQVPSAVQIVTFLFGTGWAIWVAIPG
jgi:hypothetical protein